MSPSADDFDEFIGGDPNDDGNGDDRPLGDALAEMAVDIDVDSVEAVRNLRERI